MLEETVLQSFVARVAASTLKQQLVLLEGLTEVVKSACSRRTDRNETNGCWFDIERFILAAELIEHPDLQDRNQRRP